ncbi:hypothetical protein, partial [Methylomonas albis]
CAFPTNNRSLSLMRIKSALCVLSVICLLGAVAWRLTYTKSFAPNAVFTTLKG